jgi:hypothetical protein
LASNQMQPVPQEETSAVAQLPKHKVKLKMHLQRSCNEKDEKGKLCAGHLKRWFYATDIVEQDCGDVEKAYGRNAEIYRCEYCKTLYLPNPNDPRNETVAGRGKVSASTLNGPPNNVQ